MSRHWRELLSQTPWDQLKQAFAPATTTPADLLALSDPEEADVACEQLGLTLLHRDVVYSATLPAMEVVAAMVVAGAAQPQHAFPLLEDFGYTVAMLPLESPIYRAAHQSLERVQTTVLPLIDSHDELAVHAIDLQGIVGHLGPAQQAALESCQARAYPVALAAFRALVRGGKQPRSMPADWRFAAVGAWMRLLGGVQTPADVDVLVRHWENLDQVVNVASHLPWEKLTTRNPLGALELYRRLPGEAGARGLLDVITVSRSLTPVAESELLAKIARGEVPATLAAALVQQLAPSPATLDAMHMIGFHVPRPREDVDVRADIAAALAAAADPRWESHLDVVLDTNPRAVHVMVSGPTSLARLGYAFGRAPVAGSWRLAQNVGSLLREESVYSPSDGVEALLWWLANWGSEASKAARAGVLLWLERLPGAVAQVLAGWADPADSDLLRPLSQEDPRTRLALAKLSGQAADWHAVLAEELPYLEAEVLRCYPQDRDPVFVAWARRFVADTGVSLGEECVIALARLAAGGSAGMDELWPKLLEVLDSASRASTDAAQLAIGWIRALKVNGEQQHQLRDLLRDIAVNGRGEWQASRAIAASAVIHLEGRWPAEPELLAGIVAAALYTPGEHREVLSLVAEVAKLRDPIPKAAVLAPVADVLRSDRRLTYFTLPIASDVAERNELLKIAQLLAE